MATTPNLDELTRAAIDLYRKQNGGGRPTPAAPKEDKPEFETIGEEKAKKMKGTTYSSVFGWNDKVLGKKSEFDFIITTFKVEDWPAEDQFYIPDVTAFANRVIDHAVMYPFVLAQQCEEDAHADKVMLVGPTGSGKTTMVEYYCAKINQPFFRINGRHDMESDSIIGRPWVNNGKMEYKIGDIPKAMQRGWMVLLDEPFKIPSGILMIIQRMMEKGGILQIDDMPGTLEEKQIVADKRHRIVLADNVVGTGDNIDKYGATLIQDSSLLNRIDLVLQIPYLEQEAEVDWLMAKFAPVAGKHKGIPKHRAEHMVRVLNLLRKGFDQNELSSPASLRNIEAWARKAIQVQSYSRSFSWVLLNRYAEEGEKAAVRNMYYTVFGENL